ncbi:EpsG family protein [Acinetobacter sp. YH12058]|uniref:EpsG family protein n=1 Tax=Acinetobacter sp. YH12058 TaxID=2601058 RepID=UPI0015D3CFF0|nr:EpsG family protein [Acinetobacter sp. YH12058]
MIPYFLLILITTIWIYVEKKSVNRNSFFVPLFLLSGFAGIRSYQVGTDSRTYVRNFLNNINAEYFIFDKNIELGYQVLEFLLLSLKVEYFVLFFVTALLIVFSYLIIIKKYSVNYGFSIFLFITLGTYTFFFNGLRQGMAMAFLTLATPYLLEKKLLPFLFISFFASLFHLTALFLIPFYFLLHLHIKSIYKVIIAFLSSLFFGEILVLVFSASNDRYESYSEVSESSGGVLTFFFYLILSILLFILNKFYNIRDEYYNKIYLFYCLGVFFMLPIMMLSLNPSGPQRLLNYFTWVLVLLIPFALKKINNIYITLISIILSVIYFSLTTYRFSNLTPYIINPIFEIF